MTDSGDSKRDVPTSPPACPEWPKTCPDGATLLRYAVGRGMFMHAATGALIDAGAFSDTPHGPPHGPLFLRYLSCVEQTQHMWDLALTLKATHAFGGADHLAERIWSAADAGDSYGEWLWQWSDEEGLDTQAIHDEGIAAGAAMAARLGAEE